ncbi:MAG: HAD family hydrolase [Kiritimatiellia bacterium]
MKPAAFLFDLDGTLVDTETVWARAMVDFIVAHGGRTSVGSILEMVIGRNWLDIDRALHARFPELGESTPMQDAIELRRHYARHAAEPQTMRIESSIAFFKKAAAYAPCAIVSGSPHEDVAAAAALCGIADRVKLILGAGDYDAGKPSPSGYLKAAELLGVPPADCVVIEDSAVGVAAGVAAGMKVLALNRTTTVPQQYSGYTWKVGDLSEIDVAKEFGG